MSWSKRTELLVVLLIIALVGVFFISTIREGHVWDGDFSQYLNHAKNIAEGKDYNDTGYIYNPSRSGVGPQSYPPVFPLLLAPAYKLFGLNLHAVKVENIFLLLFSLFAVFVALRGLLPARYTAAVVAVTGFNHIFWAYKDRIISAFAFTLFLYLALIAIRRGVDADGRAGSLPAAVMAGVSIYLAIGTWVIGIVLLPALIASEVIKRGRPGRFATLATLITLTLLALQHSVVSGNESYLEHFFYFFEPENLKENVVNYALNFNMFWHNGYSPALAAAFTILLTAVALAGYAIRVRDNGPGVMEIFAVLYLIIGVIWPTRIGARLLVPLVPLFLFYLFTAVKSLRLRPGHRVEGRVFILLLVAVFSSNIAMYSKRDFGPIPYSVTEKDSMELFKYMRENTDPEDVFIFRKPRVLALYTGRSASVYHTPKDEAELWAYFESIKATHFVGVKNLSAFQDNLIARNGQRLTPVFNNPSFTLFRITDRGTGATLPKPPT